MANVFISYARSSEEAAIAVAAALTAQGHEVWRDDQLPAHRTYSDVIEERLKAADAVVVLWSVDAARSQWVRAEADAARLTGTLVQATLDGAIPPLPFNQIQCADLAGWSGDESAAGWRKLSDSVGALAGAAQPAVKAGSKPAARTLSICVLPFANMSGDAEQEYFSDGISEDITTDLSKVSALAVTARNTAFTFKGRSVDVCEVADRLGVSHVLEGSVRKAGNRVRINAQLIDGATGAHLWADRYDRDLTDIFAIQDEISEAIVAALRLKLLPEEKRAIEARGTTNVDAYNIYLLARKFWVTGNYGDVRRDAMVVRTAQRAIDLDPHYAKAWALLAIAQANLRYHHGRDGDNGLAAAERALALDPAIAEAHAVIARNFTEQGDFASANRAIERGLALDPDSWDVNREAGRLAMVQRNIDDAMRYYHRAADLDEGDYHSAMMLITVHQAAGDTKGVFSAARLMLERSELALASDPLNASALGVSAQALAILGERDRAMERHERAMLIDPDNVNMPYNFACMLTIRLHEDEAALDLIEPLFKRVSPGLIRTALSDPDMDRLIELPRFVAAARAAIERTGLDPTSLPNLARDKLGV